MKKEQTFLAYCDASGLFADRFQSIGIISSDEDTLLELKREIGDLKED